MLYRFAGLIVAFFCLTGAARAAPEPRAALKEPLATQVVFLGLAGVGERVVAVGERGVVIYSDDAGESWTQADVPVRATLTAVSASISTPVDASTTASARAITPGSASSTLRSIETLVPGMG